MQRRSGVPVENTPESGSISSGFDPLTNTASIPWNQQLKKSGSLVTAVTNRTLHDETRGKLFPVVIVIMETAFSYVAASTEVYSMYCLAGYTSRLSGLEALDLLVTYRFTGSLALLPVGLLCDSYLGTFDPLMFLEILLTGFMGINAFVSLPSIIMSTKTKLWFARLSFPAFALFHIAEPLRLVVISRAIMDGKFFVEQRHFYSLLGCGIHFGMALGGTVVYFFSSNRIGLCTIMVTNFFVLLTYTTFYTVMRREFLGGKSAQKKKHFGVTEKTLAAMVCGGFKCFDKHVLRKCIFKKSSGVDGDYRCFRFDQNTQENSRALVGIVLVTVPLTGALTMVAIIGLIYYVQASMFYTYPNDPFPLLALKGFFFLLLFPIAEFLVVPCMKKWSSGEVSRQLKTIGIGALCISLAMAWSFGVQKMNRDGGEFWHSFPPGTGHVAITNCVNENLQIRSQYMNSILDDGDGWTTLPPFKTFYILNVPTRNDSRLHLEYTDTGLNMFDEYFLPFEEGMATWYLILPTGIYPFPPHCYRMNYKRISLKSMFYPIAKICVVCAMTACFGYVHFNGTDGVTVSRRTVPLVRLTGRGSNQSIDAEKIMTHFVGRYTVRTVVGGQFKGKIRRKFHRADTYMIIVNVGMNNSDHGAQTVNDEDGDDFIKLHLVKTFPKSSTKVVLQYPTAFFHALSEVIYWESLWMFLYTASPDQIRTTVFCYVIFLNIPAYAYFYFEGVLILRTMESMNYFYLATTNCFFIIIYFFCILFYLHKMATSRQTRHASKERIPMERRKSALPLIESDVVSAAHKQK